jgi:eukaryotic-like serine/threonine-protein kinase
MPQVDHFGWVGRLVGAKYRVECVVDEGPLGVVYRAHHLGFDATVALKCLKVPPELTGPRRDAFCQRFAAEGRFLHRLSRSTAGIVQALDVGSEPTTEWGEVPYLVLEWLEGVSLADDLERRARAGAGGRDLGAAMALLEPAALALAAAHEQRVAHCDVKPANLFLVTIAGRPTIKVLDFGIAKIFAEGAGREPEWPEGGEATSAFSAPYAAPEQFLRGYGGAGPRTDVFALALVLVEVVSGEQALKGADLGELLRASSDTLRRPTLRARGVTCTAEVDDVVRQALAVDPDERFATALDFWRALAAAAEAPEPPPSSKERLPRDRLHAPPPAPARVAPATPGAGPPSEVGRALAGEAQAWSRSPAAPADRASAGAWSRLAFASLVALATGALCALTVALSRSDALPVGKGAAPTPAMARFGAGPPTPGSADAPGRPGAAPALRFKPFVSPDLPP